jgi:hypothetical protein
VFAGQQHRIIVSDFRSVALLVHRFGGTPSGAFFAAALQTETSALARLAAFGRAVVPRPMSSPRPHLGLPSEEKPGA